MDSLINRAKFYHCCDEGDQADCTPPASVRNTGKHDDNAKHCPNDLLVTANVAFHVNYLLYVLLFEVASAHH